MNPIDIIPLSSEQAPAFRDIRLAALLQAPQAFGASHAIESVKPLAFFEERLCTSMVWAAQRNGTLVGVACLAPGMSDREKHKGFIWGVFVSPEVRGQGISRALLTTLLNWADQHYEQVTLTVTATNSAALALYQQAGFDVFGREPRALKDKTGYSDEVLMVRFAHQASPGPVA